MARSSAVAPLGESTSDGVTLDERTRRARVEADRIDHSGPFGAAVSSVRERKAMRDRARARFPAEPGRVVGPLLGVIASLAAVGQTSGWADSGLAALVGGLAATIAMLGSQVIRSLRVESAGEELRRARHLATYDRLTGLLNRQTLMDEVEDALKAARRTKTVVGVLFLDLDRFKAVNDSMGHKAGDELLRAVAKRLKATVRAADVVGRFGGDEFVVICRGLMEASSVNRVADSILESFRVPLKLGEGEHVTAPSIGIATSDADHPRTAEELLRDADTAMYEAKRSRSGVGVFDDRQRENLIERMHVERMLRPAMASGQFAVHYQPIVDVRLEQLLSLEALVRWNHPDHGLLGPDRFLDVVEESGMMSTLGEVVLRESLAQKAIWNHLESGFHHLSVGVNVAERQLVDPRFPDTIAAALEWADVTPNELTLEITEDLIIDHLDNSLSVLRRLEEIGVALVIDDFGTGRSSLSYVKRLDMIDGIKIDRSFVTGINTGKVDLAIVDAIVSMATALELDIVAEGVETIEQVEALRALGIYRMQGYLFDRPTPPEAVDLHASVGDALARASDDR